MEEPEFIEETIEALKVELTANVMLVTKETADTPEEQTPIEDATVLIKGKPSTVNEGFYVARATHKNGWIEPIEFQYKEDVPVNIEITAKFGMDVVEMVRLDSTITSDGLNLFVTFLDEGIKESEVRIEEEVLIAKDTAEAKEYMKGLGLELVVADAHKIDGEIV